MENWLSCTWRPCRKHVRGRIERKSLKKKTTAWKKTFDKIQTDALTCHFLGKPKSECPQQGIKPVTFWLLVKTRFLWASQHMRARPLKCLHGLLATTTNALFLFLLSLQSSFVTNYCHQNPHSRTSIYECKLSLSQRVALSFSNKDDSLPYKWVLTYLGAIKNWGRKLKMLMVERRLLFNNLLLMRKKFKHFGLAHSISLFKKTQQQNYSQGKANHTCMLQQK